MEYKSWRDFIESQAEESYFRRLMNFVDQERQIKDIYPPRKDMFSCFAACQLSDVKVVIIGQDPYHGPCQAHGMSFSVREGVKIPPSLVNIFKELQSDLGISPPKSGFLQKWAERGVLLMNTSWSVEKGKPGSHSRLGWMEFSERILKMLNDHKNPMVFILWGAHAQKVGRVVTNPKHLIIKSAHPSPFSADRGFFGSRPFSRANKFLEETGRGAINWDLN